MTRLSLAGCIAMTCLAVPVATHAQTASNFSITLGGDAYFQAGFIDQSHLSNQRQTEFRNRFRLVITPTAKSDNGLEYGGRLRLRANNADRTNDADRAYVFVRGGFGALYGGVIGGWNDEALLFMQTPSDWRLISATSNNAPFMWIGGAATGGLAGADIPAVKAGFDFGDLNPIENSATKIMYVSPRFAGFQGSIAYEPRNDSAYTDVNRQKLVSPVVSVNFPAGASNLYQDLVEADVNYDETFGDFKVRGFVSLLTGKAARTTTAQYRDLSAWHVGGQLGYGGFSIGGMYLDTGRSGISKAAGLYADRTRMYQAGAQYRTGALTVGAQYHHGEDAGSPAVAGKRSVRDWSGGFTYVLAPGLSVGAEYTYFDAKSDLTTAAVNRNTRGSALLAHTLVSF